MKTTSTDVAACAEILENVARVASKIESFEVSFTIQLPVQESEFRSRKQLHGPDEVEL